MRTPTFALLVMKPNEIDSMKQIMPSIQREWVDEILVIDGESTDGTVEFARENGYAVYVQQTVGFRRANIEVLDIIKSDYIIAFSPDGNSIAEKCRAYSEGPCKVMTW